RYSERVPSWKFADWLPVWLASTFFDFLGMIIHSLLTPSVIGLNKATRGRRPLRSRFLRPAILSSGPPGPAIGGSGITVPLLPSGCERPRFERLPKTHCAEFPPGLRMASASSIIVAGYGTEATFFGTAMALSRRAGRCCCNYRQRR